jgi:hypothetical protein
VAEAFATFARGMMGLGCLCLLLAVLLPWLLALFAVLAG